MTSNDYTFLDVTQPKDGYEVYANKFWLCENGDPAKALFYKGIYPQCNLSVLVLEYAIGRYDLEDFNLKITHVPIAYVKSIK